MVALLNISDLQPHLKMALVIFGKFGFQAVIKETDMGRIWAKSLPRPVAIVCRPIERSRKAITIIFPTLINRLNEGLLICARKKINGCIAAPSTPLSSLEKHYSSLTTQTEEGDSREVRGSVLYYYCDKRMF